MTVRNLATLDREIFQPLGRIIQEAFADGFISTGTINVTKTFTGSSVYNRALYMIGEISGGAALFGMFKFRTYLSGQATSWVQVVCANLHLKSGGLLAAGAVQSSEYNSAFYASVETESATPALAGSVLCAYQACYYIDESVSGPDDAYVIGVPQGLASGTYNWDGLLMAQNAAAIGMQTADTTFTPNWGGSIPIKIGLTTFHIPVLANLD